MSRTLLVRRTGGLGPVELGASGRSRSRTTPRPEAGPPPVRGVRSKRLREEQSADPAPFNREFDASGEAKFGG